MILETESVVSRRNHGTSGRGDKGSLWLFFLLPFVRFWGQKGWNVGSGLELEGYGRR